MSHATQFAPDRKPFYHYQPTPGPDDLEFAVEAAALAASGRPAENESPDPHPGRSGFFRALAWDSKPTGRDGQSWDVSGVPHFANSHIARVDRALAGLDAVLAVLRAADFARSEGAGGSDELGDFLTDNLHVAARELADAASRSLETFREMVERPHR